MPESLDNVIYVLLVSIAVALSIFCGIQMDRHHWRGVFRGRPSDDEVPRPMLLATLLKEDRARSNDRSKSPENG